MNFSSPLTVLYNRETRVETCFERVPAPERFFPSKIASLRFQTVAALRSNDPRFFSYLPIENPSKRPGASPRRKSKSNSFRATVMRSEILTCQPQTVLLTLERLPIREGQSARRFLFCFLNNHTRSKQHTYGIR